MKIERKHKPALVIPMAAMADIAMLLLIFFLVTSTLVKEASIKIDLPDAEAAKEQEPQQKSVTIDENGAIYYNGVPVSGAELKAQLTKALARAATDKDRVVSLKGDRNRPCEAGVTVIDIVTELQGFIAIISETREEVREDEDGGGPKVSAAP